MLNIFGLFLKLKINIKSTHFVDFFFVFGKIFMYKSVREGEDVNVKNNLDMFNEFTNLMC